MPCASAVEVIDSAAAARISFTICLTMDSSLYCIRLLFRDPVRSGWHTPIPNRNALEARVRGPGCHQEKIPCPAPSYPPPPKSPAPCSGHVIRQRSEVPCFDGSPPESSSIALSPATTRLPRLD